MKTITETKILIESFKELLNLSKGHQLTAQEVINERSYINGNYDNFKLTPEVKEEIINMIVDALGGQKNTKENIKYNLLYSRPQHWGLGRVFFREYKNDKGEEKIHCSYCAGQDGQAETAQIRKALK